jgi:hemerythrin-like domain-containing protein
MNRTHSPVDPDGPCDTRMMGVVHSALRRDLVRARLVLQEEPPLSERRRVALAEHLVWLMDFLHAHHSNEDAGLYPMVLRNDPSSAALVADMDADHQSINPAMSFLAVEAGRFREDGTTAPAVVEALDRLDTVLIPHLSREETEMMPVVATCVTQRELTTWDEEMNVGGKPMRQLAMEGHWLLDGLDAVGRELTLGLVPPVQRFVLLNLLGGPYRRRRNVLWRHVPAGSVPSLSIDTYPKYLP